MYTAEQIGVLTDKNRRTVYRWISELKPTGVLQADRGVNRYNVSDTVIILRSSGMSYNDIIERAELVKDISLLQYVQREKEEHDMRIAAQHRADQVTINESIDQQVLSRKAMIQRELEPLIRAMVRAELTRAINDVMLPRMEVYTRTLKEEVHASIKEQFNQHHESIAQPVHVSTGREEGGY